ncbi:MAG TPA: hypothetical protein VMN58_03160 [Acidimicrobiales bacterium]|nr:hypothetical protein [Acidimicrobiales bacterium]
MVALIASTLATILMSVAIVAYGKRRPPGTPLTWGEAMVAATYVFAIFTLAYGVVPHQWLTLAESELNWRQDRLVSGPFGIIEAGPIEITYRVLKDLVATIIYVVFLGGHIALWAIWQGRGKEKPKEIPTSPYGRPLARKA